MSGSPARMVDAFSHQQRVLGHRDLDAHGRIVVLPTIRVLRPGTSFRSQCLPRAPGRPEPGNEPHRIGESKNGHDDGLAMSRRPMRAVRHDAEVFGQQGPGPPAHDDPERDADQNGDHAHRARLPENRTDHLRVVKPSVLSTARSRRRRRTAITNALATAAPRRTTTNVPRRVGVDRRRTRSDPPAGESAGVMERQLARVEAPDAGRERCVGLAGPPAKDIVDLLVVRAEPLPSGVGQQRADSEPGLVRARYGARPGSTARPTTRTSRTAPRSPRANGMVASVPCVELVHGRLPERDLVGGPGGPTTGHRELDGMTPGPQAQGGDRSRAGADLADVDERGTGDGPQSSAESTNFVMMASDGFPPKPLGTLRLSRSMSPFQGTPYSSGVAARWSRLTENTHIDVTRPTAVAAANRVVRTGTEAGPGSGLECEADSEHRREEPPAAATAAATPDRFAVPASGADLDQCQAGSAASSAPRTDDAGRSGQEERPVEGDARMDLGDAHRHRPGPVPMSPRPRRGREAFRRRRRASSWPEMPPCAAVRHPHGGEGRVGEGLGLHPPRDCLAHDHQAEESGQSGEGVQGDDLRARCVIDLRRARRRPLEGDRLVRVQRPHAAVKLSRLVPGLSLTIAPQYGICRPGCAARNAGVSQIDEGS